MNGARTTPEAVLVTGGAGFIGSHLCDALLAEGHRVLAVDDLSLGRIEHLGEATRRSRFSFLQADVLDDVFLPAVERFRPGAVFHLAANSDIRAGEAGPREDLERTLGSTLCALDACVRSGCGEFVLASSSAVVGETGDDRPIREDRGPLKPISYYGAAKMASEGFVSAYAHQHGLRSWILRFPNVVGPRATHGVIHDLLRKIAADPTSLEVLGDGSQRKPYLLIDDLLAALMAAWTRLVGECEVLQVAGSGTTSVRFIAEEIVRRVAPGARIVYTGGDRGWRGDVPRFRHDPARLEALGWRPALGSDAAIVEAIRRMALEMSG